MSGREWKPGDVAQVRIGENWHRAIRDRIGWVVATTDGPGDHTATCEGVDYETRPLVVIDPEDREQVDALTKALVEACYADGNVVCAGNGIHPDTTTAALREFADPKPPKPEEPTGLGAVVEDDHGRRYVRAGEGWLPERVPGPFRNPVDWDGITAVRVLSEGVQAGESA